LFLSSIIKIKLASVSRIVKITTLEQQIPTDSVHRCYMSHWYQSATCHKCESLLSRCI